jgi:hypothetical protein
LFQGSTALRGHRRPPIQVDADVEKVVTLLAKLQGEA